MPEKIVSGASVLSWDVDPDICVVPVAGREKGDSLHVVPVEVTQQDCTVVRLSIEQCGEAAEPGSGV